jgi:hypothetical protein
MSITREYQEHLATMHASDRSWGSSAIRFGGPDILGLIMQRKYIRTVLDFGCGKGLMGEFVAEALPGRVEWFEYDPGIPGKDKLPDGRFDMVLTCDVLEHVEPEHLDDTLRQIADRAQFVMYNNIACTPTNNDFTTGPHAGKNIHLIVKPPIWWRDRIGSVTEEKIQLWEYRHCERMKQGTYRPRATLIHERVG